MRLNIFLFVLLLNTIVRSQFLFFTTISTNKNTYFLGETIEITITLINGGTQTVLFGSTAPANYYIDGWYSNLIGLPIIDSLRPNQFKVWQFNHDSIRYFVGVGLHNIRGVIFITQPSIQIFTDNLSINVINNIPVELTSFTFSQLNQEVHLSWLTASETNNKGFSVQRSFNYGSWEDIGFVNGKGTTTQQQNYSYVDRKLSNGSYSYRLKQVDYDGSESYSDVVSLEVTLKLDGYALNQNFPNPFNPSTNISYSIPAASFVTLKVYDVVGNEVASLVNENKEIGYYEVTFNAKDLSNGVYFYELIANDFRAVKKLVLMK